MGKLRKDPNEPRLTTVVFPLRILKALKDVAAEQRVSVRQIVLEAVAKHLGVSL